MVIVSKGWNYQFFAVIGLITSIMDECACNFMDGLFHFLSWPDYSNSTHSAVWNSWILALSCLKWRRQLALTNDCLQLYCKILISLNRLHDQVVACLAQKFSPPSTILNWVLLYYSRSKSKQHNFYISYGYIEWTIDLLHSFGKEETFISSFKRSSLVLLTNLGRVQGKWIKNLYLARVCYGHLYLDYVFLDRCLLQETIPVSRVFRLVLFHQYGG